MKPMAATTIIRTERDESGGLALTLADCHGRTSSVTLAGDLISVLAGVLSDLSPPSRLPGALTKMPQDFSIGSGVHEPVVLVRFEDDVAYGLDPETAMDLGYALIDQAAAIAREPRRRLI
jgi:hypothetical protein